VNHEVEIFANFSFEDFKSANKVRVPVFVADHPWIVYVSVLFPGIVWAHPDVTRRSFATILGYPGVRDVIIRLVDKVTNKHVALFVGFQSRIILVIDSGT